MSSDTFAQLMAYLQPIFMILMALTGIATIVLILMQKGGGDNISAIGGGSSETYVGKKPRSKDRNLKIGTVICGVLMVLFSIGYFVLFLIWDSMAA